MPNPTFGDLTPQFRTAEDSAAKATDTCAGCFQPITTRYYRVNNKMACESCANRLQYDLQKDPHTGYARGLLFGAGAAIVGMALYAGITILTGLNFGYASFGVGWLIGKAIMLGSKGVGGRRYQIAAVLLTYAAVSVAAVPVMIHYYVQQKSHAPTAQSRQHQPAQGAQDHNAQGNDSQQETSPKMSFGAAVLQLLLIGLASPFLELANPLSGLIGLVILFVGMRIAWRMTQGGRLANIHGPYEVAAAAAGMR
ncbi:MAG TPA: hypothetical protein VFB79_05630 [Candidatus Angelobacter sp.]|nr:hypothetical protein [Candidatus Angelobacter sp.]